MKNKTFKRNNFIGGIGEQMVANYLINKGNVVYQCINKDEAHPYDFHGHLKDINNKFKHYYLDVKTKPRLQMYDYTGVDLKHWKIYKQMKSDMNVDFFIYFVDPLTGECYGGELDILDRNIENGVKSYPCIEGDFKYFPLQNMETYFKINGEDLINLRKEVCLKKLKELEEKYIQCLYTIDGGDVYIPIKPWDYLNRLDIFQTKTFGRDTYIIWLGYKKMAKEIYDIFK